MTEEKEFFKPQEILEKLNLGSGMKAAELGCGSGIFSIQMAKKVGKEGIVYAVDIQKPLLQNVETKAKMEGLDNIKTVWSDLEIFGATKIKDEILDLAIIANILFQSKKQAEILKEAARMLKKDGRLIVIDWMQDSPLGPPSSERVSPENVKKTAGTLGLELEEEFKAGAYHYGLIFRKS